MREILFRGQTRRKGEKVRMDGTPVESNWVYGGVLQWNGTISIIYGCEDPDDDFALRLEKHSVYTDTLSQFIGQTDKNGKKIFEGDILGFWSDFFEKFVGCREVVVYGVGNCGCCYDVYGWATKHKRGYGDLLSQLKNCVVLGNIYDNPELMEETQ